MVSNDLSLYSKFAHEWWDPKSPRFRSLQNLTPLRVSLIDQLVGPIHGKVIYDIGCGGGLLSIPLIDAGAALTGVDLSAASIAVANAASAQRGRFIVGDATRVPLRDRSADIVLLADVLDHIPDYTEALKEAARLVKRDGKIFIATINRTFWSWCAAIMLGEGLRLVPPGTHQHSLFIAPEELIRTCSMFGLREIGRQGESLLWWETIRRWAVTMDRGDSFLLAYSMAFSPR